MKLNQEEILARRSKLSPAKRALLEKQLRGKNEPTVQAESPSEKLPAIVPNSTDRHLPFPLTDIQQAYWIGRNGAFELSNVATHVYMEIDYIDLELERFEKTWQRLIDHHEMLRAIVQPDGQQRILEQVPLYKIKVFDLRGKNTEIVASQLLQIRDRMSHEVLPADQWPLFKIQAAQFNDNQFRLYISIDVLIGDAWSFEILSREFLQLFYNPEISLPPIELSFRDYVLAETSLRNSPLYHRSLTYWQSRLATLPPAPKLPLQKNLTAVKSPHFVRRRGTLDPDTWSRLKNRATQASLTPSGILLAAFAEILTVWSNNSRFTINLTLFNRLPLHPKVNQIVGDFTSLILLAVDNSGQDSFQVRAERLQKQFWDDLDHRYVSGVQVLRELARFQDQASGVLMPVVFTSILTHESLSHETPEQSSPKPSLGELVYSITQTPQVYLDHQVAEEAGTLVFNWDAVEELFPPGVLDDMFAAYCNFLDRLANEEEIWQATTRQLLPPAQIKQLTALNATEASIPEDALLHILFFDQVPLHPQKAAVITTDCTLTYQELSNRARQLGHQIQQLGARPNQLVAIVMEKGWEQVVAALGILTSGAAYVPIDPELPTERRWHLLQQAEVQLVSTQSWLDTTLAWPESIRRICVDDEGDREIISSPPLKCSPSDLAYVIYTSGSTGMPKGVMIDHRGAVNTILDINQRFGVSSSDCVLAISSLSFDLSVYDIFGTLAAGGTIVIPDASATKNPEHWATLIAQQQVTIWNSVPALMQMLVEYASGRSDVVLNSLRLALLSGDWIPSTLPDAIRDVIDEIQIVSLGGATEASIWSIFYPVAALDPTWKSIPYGKPLTNQRFYVLNESLEPCPVWVPGTLYIGGLGLAKGYWRDEEKTRTSFITHPETGERLYCTGDRGCYLPDGNIEFLGRQDLQVKVRGYRIELGEIEAVLGQYPGVQAAIVTAFGEQYSHKNLAAYFIPDTEPAPTPDELHSFLSQKLPSYMVPSIFIKMDKLPLSSNGKVNRRALPTPNMAQSELSLTFVEPRTPTEKTLAEIWAEVLEIEQVSIHDNFFFNLGGNSLLATQVMSRIRETFQVELPLRHFFETPTVAHIAVAIAEKLALDSDSEMLTQALAELEQLSEDEVQAILASQQ